MGKGHVCLPEANRVRADGHDDDDIDDRVVDQGNFSRTFPSVSNCSGYPTKRISSHIGSPRYAGEATAHENAGPLEFTMSLEKKGIVITSN